VVAVLHFAAIRTLVNVTSQGFSSAAFDSPHGLLVTGEQIPAIFLSIGCSVLAKYLSQPYHWISSITWLMAVTAGTSALRVRWV